MYTEQALGGPARGQESNVTIGNAVDQVVAGNPDRVGLTIINQGANDLFIATAPNPSSTNGIRVVANGGGFSLSVRDDFTLPSYGFFGICPAGNSNIYVLEQISDITTPVMSKP